MEKQTLKKLILRLGLDYVNSNITPANFPDDGRHGKCEIIDFDRIIESQEAITEMGKKGYRPATAYELLDWAKDNWDGKDCIIALRQTWCDPLGRLHVLALWSDAGNRLLNLRWFGGHWYHRYRFAFVRKESSELDTLESWKGRALSAEEKLEKIKNIL